MFELFIQPFQIFTLIWTYSSSLTGFNYAIKIHMMSDGSGYYVTGQDSSYRANIWKYKDMQVKLLIIN